MYLPSSFEIESHSQIEWFHLQLIDSLKQCPLKFWRGASIVFFLKGFDFFSASHGLSLH